VKSLVPFTAYDARGNTHVFTPSFHVRIFSSVFLLNLTLHCFFPKHADYHSRFQSLYQRIEATYLNEKPLHMADPQVSVIAILTYEQYAAMSPIEFKSLLHMKNVVVSNYPVPKINFDEQGLQTLTSMHLSVSLHGL
jgi:hypothetical protein